MKYDNKRDGGGLLELARANALRYSSNPAIKAIIITGSVARDTTDELSDIDTILYSDEAYSEQFFEEEQKLAYADGGDMYGGSAADGFGLYRFVNGIRCDFGFAYCRDVESLLDDVLLEYDPDLDKQLIIEGIRSSRILHGSELINAWIKRSDVYPAELAAAMLQRYLSFTPHWVLRFMGAGRCDRLFLRESFLELQKRILALMFALNRRYHPGKLKGIAAAVEGLEILPPRLLERFDALYDADLHSAVSVAAALVEDTLTLVEEHAPAFETSAARRRFAWQPKSGANAGNHNYSRENNSHE